MADETRADYEEVTVTDEDGCTILIQRIGPIIYSPVDPFGHVDVRTDDLWIDTSQQGDDDGRRGTAAR